MAHDRGPRFQLPIHSRAALLLASALGGIIAGSLLSGALLLREPGPQLPGGAPTSSPTTGPTHVPTSTPSRSPVPIRPTPDPTPIATATPMVEPTPAPTAVPTPSPTPVSTPAPTPPHTPVPSDPPDCRYDDLITFHPDLDSWRISLLDTIYLLPSTYAPGDLVDTAAAGLNGGYAVRRLAVDDLAEMTAAARADGARLAVVSAYRSYAQQASTFQHWVDVAGYEAALHTSARAGHSEHQLGTTLDFTSADGPRPWEYADWAQTREGSWMAANAWRYGFVQSYPRGSFVRACYDYEPWHYRYVGRDLAARIHDSGLVPRQVLWALQ